MDLHFATERVASLTDAALRYIVIVAGILTALALNQWIESRTQARLGAVALAEIEAELQRNQKLLVGVLARQAGQLERLDKAESLLGKDSFAAPGLDNRARQLLQSDLLDEVGNINLAALQRSAWDTAVASQSLRYLPRDRTEPFARFYAASQEISNVARQLTASPYNLGALSVLDAFSRNESDNALGFARALREHRLTLVAVNSGYKALEAALANAMDARGDRQQTPSRSAAPVDPAPSAPK
jgi:hypothetical protein